ncbi:unnamed protein product [Arabidopsis halleri]
MRHMVTEIASGRMVRTVLGTDGAFGLRTVAGWRGRLAMSSSNRLDSKGRVSEDG